VQTLLSRKCKNYCLFWMCVCSLRHSACKAHAPNRPHGLTGSTTFFPHYFIKGTIFEKEKSYW